MRTRKFGVKNPDDGTFDGYIIKCPGCKMSHVLDHRWKFNGDLEKPTFTPSLLVRIGKYANPEWFNSLSEEDKELHEQISFNCHSYITDGRIQFLSDCTHNLVNQIVDLPEVEPLEL